MYGSCHTPELQLLQTHNHNHFANSYDLARHIPGYVLPGGVFCLLHRPTG